jgi:hypothetical protein
MLWPESHHVSSALRSNWHDRPRRATSGFSLLAMVENWEKLAAHRDAFIHVILNFGASMMIVRPAALISLARRSIPECAGRKDDQCHRPHPQ